MQKRMDDLRNLDWSLVAAFVAVAETGSLSGAARQMNSTQPTLGRQIKALEQERKAKKKLAVTNIESEEPKAYIEKILLHGSVGE